MADSINAIQFEQRAKEEPHLREFLQEVAEDVNKEISIEESQRFDIITTGVGILFSVVSYALYRWIKGYFDHRQAGKEVETLKQQTEVVKDLTESGFPPELAQTTVVKLLEHIGNRAKDDPALKVALDLIGKAN